jgi:hypothetical protein
MGQGIIGGSDAYVDYNIDTRGACAWLFFIRDGINQAVSRGHVVMRDLD